MFVSITRTRAMLSDGKISTHCESSDSLHKDIIFECYEHLKAYIKDLNLVALSTRLLEPLLKTLSPETTGDENADQDKSFRNSLHIINIFLRYQNGSCILDYFNDFIAKINVETSSLSESENLLYLLLERNISFKEKYVNNGGTPFLGERIFDYFKSKNLGSWRNEIYSLSQEGSLFDKEFVDVLINVKFKFNECIIQIFVLLAFSSAKPTIKDLFMCARSCGYSEVSSDDLDLILLQGQFDRYAENVYAVSGNIPITVHTLFLLYTASKDENSEIFGKNLEEYFDNSVRVLADEFCCEENNFEMIGFYLSLSPNTSKYFQCYQLTPWKDMVKIQQFYALLAETTDDK